MIRFYDSFLQTLAERYPRKSDLTNALMDVLPLEKESIYRRLRKDVYFTAEETMQIANAWNISLDNTICTNSNKTRPFHLDMIEYVRPQESDYELLEKHNRILEVIGRDPDGKIIEVTSTLPRSLYCRSELLTRFFTMKWLYKYGLPEDALPFSDIHIPERIQALDREYIDLLHNISEVHKLHDSRFIEYLVDDIVYFHTIGMVTNDEVTLLRNELLTLIDYMVNTATKGYFHSGKRFFFYLSYTWMETEYFLYESKSLTMSFVTIFGRNSIASFDRKVFDKFMNMAQFVKRSSVQMSESNALKQVEFFANQKNKIMTL